MSMKRFDFIIAYEHKNREMESIVLLKYLLEKKGYTVLVYSIYDYRIKAKIDKFYAEVLIIPYAYDEETLYHIYRKAIKYNKLVNMQWEQAIYRNQEDDANSFKNPSGICKEAVHLSWGKANVNRLINIAKMSPEKVKLVGSITMDFLKPPLNEIYKPREQLFKEYSIPEDKKICLFIASFKSATYTQEVLEAQCRQYGEWRRDFHHVALQSMNKIIEWIVWALQEDEDLFFIYRPHPGERTDYVKKIADENDRLVIISEESVKQWIIAVDNIYTWMSTAVAEVYFAGKNCQILYPVEVKRDYYEKIFDNAVMIDSYEKMIQSIQEPTADFPIAQEDINRYYLVDDRNTYDKICDTLTEVYKYNKYSVSKEDQERLRKQYGTKKGLNKIKEYLCQFDIILGFRMKLATSPLGKMLFSQNQIKRIEFEQNYLDEEYITEKEWKTLYNRYEELVRWRI